MRRRPNATRSLAVGLGAAVVAAALLPAAASAAPSNGQIRCVGYLDPQTPTLDDPNLTGYQFDCSQSIASYTLVVNRQGNDYSTLDDLSSTASVYDATNTIVSSTVTVGCQGILPGNGISCWAQSPTTPQSILNNSWVHGSFDTTDVFCSNIPLGSKPGTKAEPSAFVQLIVSDVFGNEFGPYRLHRRPVCSPSPKPKPMPKKKKSKGAGKHHSKSGVRSS